MNPTEQNFEEKRGEAGESKDYSHTKKMGSRHNINNQRLRTHA